MKYIWNPILFVIFGIVNSVQLNHSNDTAVCRNVTTGVTKCCYNHEKIGGMCLQCKNGTVAEAGSPCKPCKQNMYGYKCVEKCNCDQFQRCDAVVGCILKRIVSTKTTTYIDISPDKTIRLTTSGPVITKERVIINSEISTARRIVTDNFVTNVLNEIFTTDKTTSIDSGTSNMEWLIYTLCIAGVLIVTGLIHLFRSYKKHKSKERLVNEDVVLDRVHTSPYSGFYDEIDEDMLTDDKVNFVPQDNHSDTKSIGLDDTGYLDPCFAIEEDESQTLKDTLSHTECNSTSSSNSDVAAQNNTEYLHPYHSLQENWKEDSHGYEVAVTVHFGTESSSGSDEEITNHKYSHVYQSLQKDRDMKGHAYEKPQTPTMKNDTKIQLASPFIRGSNSPPDYVNTNAESDKTIDRCNEMEADHKDSSDETELKTTGKQISRDSLVSTEHSAF